MQPRRTSVVVVNHNAGLLLVDCLRSIHETTAELSPEVILVDNASTDGSLEAARLAYPQTRILENDENVGFPIACNQGIYAASGDFILLLNPDAALVGGSLASMVEYLESHPDVGIVGPRLLAGNGKPVPSAHSLPTTASFVGELLFIHSALRRLPGRLPRNSEDPRNLAVRQVGWVLGAALAFRRALIDEIGPLDPRLFWVEDIDICRRTRAAGLKVVYLPAAEVLHWEGVCARNNYSVSIPTKLAAPLEYCKKYSSASDTLTVATASALHAAIMWLSLSLGSPYDGSRATRARAYKDALANIVNANILKSEPSANLLAGSSSETPTGIR